MPHGKSACVKQPFVLFARKAQAIRLESQRRRRRQLLDLPLGVPQSGEEDQVKIIGTLCRNDSPGFYSPTATGRRRPGACR
ncbi:hypothetical protein ACLB1E_04520 [Escherichia coli]